MINFMRVEKVKIEQDLAINFHCDLDLKQNFNQA